ncbi:MAG: hypothetical protein SGJ21_11800, partial [Alphaproteobacteria bacterium]|nr:hypothetical protein [Alphaproteobacteria bacterium]
TLKSRNEQLVLVDLLQCRRNFHHNPFRAARALNVLYCTVALKGSTLILFARRMTSASGSNLTFDARA